MENPWNFEPFADNLSELAKSLAKAFESIREQGAQIQTINKQLIESISASVEKLPWSVKQFAKTGWFFTTYMSFGEMHNLADLVEEKKYSEIDEFMTDHIQQLKKQIFKTLIERFPERSKILNSAIQAHDRQDYYASIPIFLSQSDGLCQQITGYKLYTMENHVPKVSKYYKNLKEGNLDHILLEAITIPSSLTAHQKDMEEYLGFLNRHEVLHGISLDYGTEINSCKSISLINFITEILWEVDLEYKKSRRI